MKLIMSRHFIHSAVPFATGLFFFIQSGKLSLGALSKPGPGLWPTCLSLLIMLGSIAVFATERRRADPHEEAFTASSRFPLYGMLALGTYIVGFDLVGLTLPTFCLLLYWIRGLGRESWLLAVVMAVSLTALMYVVFAWGLRIPFPDDKLVQLWEG